MTRLDDQKYLRDEQYRDASRLNARINLHARFSVNPQDWYQWLFDHFDFPGRVHLLELGCGPGLLWMENQARLPGDWDILLSDFSPGMLDEARVNLAHMPHSFKFAVIDAQSIPYADALFDAVIANLMLHHVPGKERALMEIRRVLKPGACLYAATVGADHMRELPELVFDFDPNITLRAFDRHAAFDLDSGREQLRAVFTQVEVYTYEDALQVTEAAPLVDYLYSDIRWSLDETQREAFQDYIQVRLDSSGGVIYIPKDLGMLVAC